MDVVVTEPVEERKTLSRRQRQGRKIKCMSRELDTLQELIGALLNALDRTIQPSITDADRIRYRCMVQNIRQELNDEKAAG